MRNVVLFSVLGIVLFASPSFARTFVQFQTSLGNVDVELFDESTPKTVANFLNYVDDGDFTDSFIHRSVSNFIIQGGGFIFKNQSVNAVASDKPVPNEFKFSNKRGTIAMAKLGGDPNSATCEWFFNLADNSANLDNQNGGFTVFGQVVDGMDNIDAIASLPVYNAGSPFDTLPLMHYSGGNVSAANLVNVRVVRMSEFLGMVSFFQHWLFTNCTDSSDPGTRCEGTDLDGNHSVNVKDLAIYAEKYQHRYNINLTTFSQQWLKNGYGWDPGTFNWCDRLDINMDGKVDFKDYALYCTSVNR